MRKLTLLIVLALCVNCVRAQKSKVTSAGNYLNSGKLDKAKSAIDQAIKHEKCVKWPKAYVIKGKVYQGIYESPLPAFKKLSNNALEIALNAYKMAMKLDHKGKQSKTIKLQVTNLIPDFTNMAVTSFNNGDYKSALGDFERVLEIETLEMFKEMSVDTAVIFNAGMAAHKAELYDKAIEYFLKALNYNYGKARTYTYLSACYKANNQPEEALEYMVAGAEKYPNDEGMLVELINYYLNVGESENATSYLDKAIAMNPENGSYYCAKGNLFEKLKRFQEAEQMYLKALDINNKDFTAQYNLGLIHLNKVVVRAKEVNEINDVKKYNSGVKEVLNKYKAVIPFFERALEIQPNEKNSLLALKEIYFRLRNESDEFLQKYEQIKVRLESM